MNSFNHQSLIFLCIVLGGTSYFSNGNPLAGNVELVGEYEYRSVARISWMNPQSPNAGPVLICSGSLLTLQHVITAASCLNNRQREDLRVGISSDGSWFGWMTNNIVLSMKTYSQWAAENFIATSSTGCNDVAVLKLLHNIIGSHPARISVNRAPAAGTRVTLTGWTANAAERPGKKSMRILSASACGARMKTLSLDPLKTFELLDDLLCASAAEGVALIEEDDRGAPVYLLTSSRDIITGIAIQRCPFLGRQNYNANQVNLFLRLRNFREFISNSTDNRARYIC